MFVITKSNPSEYEEIHNVVKQSWIFSFAYGDITKEDIESAFATVGEYSVSYVAKDSNKIIGVITGIDKGEYVYLKQIYILPEYHRKGVGAALLKTLPQKRIVLQVAKDNKQAINFYIKHGYTKLNKSDSVFVLNSKEIPVEYYEKVV